MEKKKAKLDSWSSSAMKDPQMYSNQALYWIDLFSEDAELNKDFECPSEIRTKDSNLEKELFKYLSSIVPTLLTESKVGGVLRFSTDEKEFEKLISKELEYFICQTYDSKEVLEEFSNPSKFCGKVFGLGDPTYTCKDCASDPTCVFCHDCFFNSTHQEHKYRMHASSGSGGYCDCGDEEAWSEDPACSKHKDGLNVDDTANPMDKLPDDIRRRAVFLIHFLIQYSIDLVCWEENDQLPYPLTLSDTGKENFIVMLFNDESHTYEEVIETLQSAVPDCQKNHAVHFATIVDKMGRSAILKGEKSKCEQAVQKCKEMTSRNDKDPLKCEAIMKDVVAHQYSAQSVMNWLLNIINYSDGLRRILTMLCTKQLYGRPTSILEQVVTVDVKLWKAARQNTHQLFMNGLLMDMYGRQQFSITFTKHYSQIMKDFIEDDHDHSVSVASLSVQIFTVPTLAEMLMENHGALSKCFEAFWNELKQSLGEHGWLDFQNTPGTSKIKRADFILRDIVYLLRHKPKWSEKLKVEFLLAFDRILQLLKAMQGMDSCHRHIKTHVTYEPNWEAGFNLQIFFVPVIEMLLHWTCSDFEVYKVVVFKCVSELMKLYPKLDFKVANNALVCNYDVSKRLVSVHAPLTRFIAGLIPGAVKFPNVNLQELLQVYGGLPEKEKLKTQVTLVEAPLRSLVLMAQQYAQMWKRNGYALIHQVYYYHNIKSGTEMFDRDVLMLQVMSTIMAPNHFLDNLVHKYNLSNFFTYVLILDKVNKEEDKSEVLEKNRILVHELFHLLYFILIERYVLNLSKATSREILRREVCHRLALGRVTRSSLIKHLAVKDHEIEDDSIDQRVDDILKEVAEYNNPGVDGKGTYQLRKELMQTVTRYFYHYARSERVKLAEEKKKHAKLFPDLKEFEMEQPPEWCEIFVNILNLFQCERMEFLLRSVLNYPKYFASEETVEIVLLILGTGLLEAKRHPTLMPNFIPMLTRPMKEGKNIKTLLEEMMKGENTYSGALKWTVQKLREALPDEDDQEQGSEKTSDTEDAAKVEKLRRKRLAQEQRTKMMAKMNNMQQAFMNSHKGFFNKEEGMELDENVDLIDGVMSDAGDCSAFPVALGPNCTTVDTTIAIEPVQCILCQEEQSVDNDESMFLMTCFQQKSSVYTSGSIDDVEDVTVKPELDGMNMTHVSSCGHIIHSECWMKYYTSLKERYRPFHRQQSVDVRLSEYWCPLCNSLCNTVLPLLPRFQEEKSTEETTSQELALTFTELFSYMDKFSAELSSLPQRKADTKGERRTTTRRFFSSGFYQTVQSYLRLVGTDEEGGESVMDMFPKKLLQLNGISGNGEKSVCHSWMVFSFTLQSIECSHREEQKNVFSELSQRDWMFLHAFVQYLSSTAMAGVYEPIQSYGTQIFKFLCGGSDKCTLQTMDMFGLMISLHYLLTACGTIFQEKQPNFIKIRQCHMNHAVFRVCLIAQFVKIMSTVSKKDVVVADEMSGQSEELDDKYLIDAWKFVQSLAGNSTHNDIIDGHYLKEHVNSEILPFLRCSAMFFQLLVGVSLPDELKRTDLSTKSEMSLLCKYLDLPPNLEDLFSVDALQSDCTIKNMIESWFDREVMSSSTESPMLGVNILSSRRLIELPEQFSTLIKQASGFKCPTVGDSSRLPAMCLICGEMICSQCYCCVSTISQNPSGASTSHALKCGRGTGVFLRVRDCEVYLLYNQKKGFFMPAPYLDMYGEPDRGFHRGNPLFLSKERYEKLQEYWLKHKIPVTIVRAMESNRNLIAFDWDAI